MTGILRAGLLGGRSVLVEAIPESGLPPGLRELEARVDPLTDGGAADGPAVDALVIDCSRWVPDEEPPASVLQLLDRVWRAVEAVANATFIPRGAGGQILFVAPARRDRFGVPAAVAALENLSRTLSVEWARYGITVCTVAPSPQTSDAELTTLVAYLLSRAGAYFSGTRLNLHALSG
jgi:hypothetical protein